MWLKCDEVCSPLLAHTQDGLIKRRRFIQDCGVLHERDGRPRVFDGGASAPSILMENNTGESPIWTSPRDAGGPSQRITAR